jgi:predicted nucleotidyltransferase
MVDHPTPYPEVNDLVRKLVKKVQTILGSHLVGMFLEGSLANGDFDLDSDIDFVVVTDEAISDDLFSALQAMHERIAMLDSRWAIQLEGSYVPQAALRRYDPDQALHPNRTTPAPVDSAIRRYKRNPGLYPVCPGPQSAIHDAVSTLTAPNTACSRRRCAALAALFSTIAKNHGVTLE